jgi:DNA-3-methyladenine glycosylase
VKVEPGEETLEARFFARDAEVVARDLIGCYLFWRRGKRILKCRITETEAYVGPHDLACHAHRGRTKQTELMFGHRARFTSI